MATLVPRIYQGFRGVDFRGEEINLMRSPDSLNMWKDYKETESIRTRPGWEKVCQILAGDPTKEVIYGMHFYHDELFVHVTGGLYKVVDGKSEQVTIGDENIRLGNRKTHSFVYEDKLYILGAEYLCYNGSSWTRIFEAGAALEDVHSYVPTTSIGRKPSGCGTVHEDVNLLCEWRCNTFVGDGESTDYYLDAKDLTSGHTPRVTVNGTETNAFSVNYATGCVKFTTAPPAPATDGQDNVVIKFWKPVTIWSNGRPTGKNADKILFCTLSQVFDNRVFVSGNPDYPNMVWHCSLNDPTYFSDLDYYREGLDDANITGLVAGNNALWVFREPSDANTTIFYHTPTIDDQYGKIYPSTHSSISLGCVGGAINFNDDIVFFSQRGMEGISGDVTTEQVVAHRSTLVDRNLLADLEILHKGWTTLSVVEWDGYLVVAIAGKIYLADSRAVFTNGNHTEYEWFVWDYDEVRSDYASAGAEVLMKVHDGVLYLARGMHIYTLTDKECDVESYWVTPKDKFQYPHKLKTTSKRGCVAEATGDIAVHVKTEKTDFALIGEYKDVKDYFVSRIKMKKFKDIQLKFASNTRFSLETVTLEAFVGGYIKR